MTDKQALLDLADRCERASGADRGLDAAIHEHLCDGFDMMPDATEDEVGGLLPEGVDAAGFIEAAGGFAVVTVPRYTASIDAAMTLVPEKHAVDLTLWGPVWEGKHRARILPLVENRDRLLHRGCDPHFCVNAATPALALTAAALRARSA